jgi:hypothetical protein
VADQHDGSHGFDFLIGNWKAHVRRLPERLVGSNTWVVYDGVSNHKKLLDSNANFEEFEGSLRSAKHLAKVGAHGAVIFAGRRQKLGSELDLRAVALGAA